MLEEGVLALIYDEAEIYVGVIVAVNHDVYAGLDEDYFKGLMNGHGVVVDIKGIYKNKIKDLSSLSL